MSKEKKTIISVTMSPDILEALETQSKEAGMSKNQYIQYLIDECYNELKTNGE